MTSNWDSASFWSSFRLSHTFGSNSPRDRSRDRQARSTARTSMPRHELSVRARADSSTRCWSAKVLSCGVNDGKALGEHPEVKPLSEASDDRE